jgi:HD-GYP domain-containing protein (c-di-GMP phosphodiesterase class II)
MPEEQRERVREIARKYTWVNVQRIEESLIAEDELYQLTISLGTLSPEERQTINNHVVSTIHMLEKLPYPKRLRNIPKYAGAHHEHMDGTGYPLRLTRDEIPLAGRIIGIADIFEALTASDRPYKKAKNLPEAMRILHEMAQKGHIDPDLYDLFVSQKIHLRYADKYLNVGRCAKEAGKLT